MGFSLVKYVELICCRLLHALSSWNSSVWCLNILGFRLYITLSYGIFWRSIYSSVTIHTDFNTYFFKKSKPILPGHCGCTVTLYSYIFKDKWANGGQNHFLATSSASQWFKTRFQTTNIDCNLKSCDRLSSDSFLVVTHTSTGLAFPYDRGYVQVYLYHVTNSCSRINSGRTWAGMSLWMGLCTSKLPNERLISDKHWSDIGWQ